MSLYGPELTKSPCGRMLSIYNPLPAALRHYQRALEDTANRCGVKIVRLTAATAEGGAAGRAGRARHLLNDRWPQRPKPALVLWPAFGYLEPVTWLLSARGAITVVCHDPTPLSAALGYGRLARLAGRVARGAREIRYLVHSDRAAIDLRRAGFPVHWVLPHPYVDRSVRPAAGLGALLAGQNKDSRDLSLLSDLGAHLGTLGIPARIIGRGWPQLPGWQVDGRFVAEAEFEQALADAGAVILPYRRVYQSGVVVRAAELGVGCVGTRGSNIAEVFGADWPGLIADKAPPAEWAAAVQAVTAHSAADVNVRVENWKKHVDEAWDDYFARTAAVV